MPEANSLPNVAELSSEKSHSSRVVSSAWQSRICHIVNDGALVFDALGFADI